MDHDEPDCPAHPDVLIIGGGPAGLTAALYLARYHLRTLVIDAGHSRAAFIPRTHNLAGHPEGIAGPALLARMRRHADRYGARFVVGEAVQAAQGDTGFTITLANGDRHSAPALLLATGVRNHRPAMPQALHDEAVACGLIRYCPVCDGYEVTDRRVAVLGTGAHAMREALFLRSYTPYLSLIAPAGGHELDDGQRARLADAGIRLIDGPATDFPLLPDGIAVQTADGRHRFETLYPALGSAIHNHLARQLDATLSPEGRIRVDSHQRTSIAGVYAAGDVVLGLDQISHAMGEAGVAATAMRNDLAAVRRLWR